MPKLTSVGLDGIRFPLIDVRSDSFADPLALS